MFMSFHRLALLTVGLSLLSGIAMATARADEPKRLTATEARADIDQLQTLLENEHAYLTVKGFDYAQAFDALRDRCDKGIARREFAIGLAKILALFGDAHTRARGKEKFLPRGFTPFVIEDVNGRLIALKRSRSKLLKSKYPYLTKIDGVDAEKWVKAAGTIVAQGSPQFVRYGSIKIAHWVRFVRGELGHKQRKSISVELTNNKGTKTKTLDLDISSKAPKIFAPAPEAKVEMLEGNIGYLPIPEMAGGRFFLRALNQAMEKLKKTDGLIIDVRGNPGGNRYVLRALFPKFMTHRDGQRVINVAAYRLQEGDSADEKEGFLEDHMLWPLTAKKWYPHEREPLEAFAKQFKPEWQPPAGKFSGWHYMLTGAIPGMGGASYKKHVVILMDVRCFDATDIFLGAFKGWRNVTLMGRPSGGSSGRARETTLAHSGLTVAVSSMVSFQPNGKLHDGNGIQPDVVIPQTIKDILDKTDTTLDAALARLRKGEKAD